MDERARQREELTAWVLSKDARAAARADLRRYGLPHGADQVDDVVFEVAARVLAQLAAGPLDQRGGSTVAAYARRSITNAAIDLVRGRHECSLDEILDAGGGSLDPALVTSPADDSVDNSVDDDPSGSPTVLVDRAAPGAVADICRSLHRDLARRYTAAWMVAAALVVVALSQDDDLPVADDIPRPDARHGGAGRADQWAALAYAGQTRCFADPDTGAVRERRHRAMGQVVAALRRAHAVAAVPEEAR